MRRELYKMAGLPVLQNRTFPTESEAISSSVGDMVLVQDSQSGLVFNEAFDPSLLVYDQDYQNEQACSPFFRAHLNDVEAIIARYFTGKSLLEVGCGKGYFLDYLAEKGYDIEGIDPAYEGSNPRVRKAIFKRGSGVNADAIILRHVLEHIPNPVQFLAEVAGANGGHGLIYIEVPCFDWIIEHRAWFDIFYEHVNYFRLADFGRIFGTIVECGKAFGGQYLFVVADLATLMPDVRGAGAVIDLPSDFLVGIDDAVDAVRKSPNRRNLIWGASSKGVIFSNHLRRRGIVFDGAVDINPAKQGRFLPGSGLRVLKPDRVPDVLSDGDNIFVMNSNYLDEIIGISSNRYSYLTVDNE